MHNGPHRKTLNEVSFRYSSAKVGFDGFGRFKNGRYCAGAHTYEF
jgi:hypothetical protein